MPFDPAIPHSIVLRHGLPAILRQLSPDDRDRVRAAFQRLSSESTYLRFWTRFRQINPKFIEQLLAPGDATHATWIIILTDSTDIPGVGGGSFWRISQSPSLAEVSFTIADEFQNQGNGTILLAALWLHATSLGITHFIAHVLDENLVMRAWWDALGATATVGERGWQLTLPLDQSLLPSTPTTRSLLRWLSQLETAPHSL
jgi:RimJ/RimL family protein N-acetyltransferase